MDPVLDVLDVVRRVIGDGSRNLQRPDIAGVILDGSAVFDYRYVDKFEEQLKDFTGCSEAVATSSGSAAITLALVAAGVKVGDEVLCPSLTFAATANSIVHAGGIPHFVDVNQATLGVHLFKLQQYLLNGFEPSVNGLVNLATRRIVRAIVPVHLLGIPCDIEAITEFCGRLGVVVVEDAAEALGSFTPSIRHCGTIGKAGALSFNLNKMVTTGGGGAVLTNDHELAERVRHLADQGKIEHRYHWRHDEVGWNYGMSPFNAALGIPQMSRLGETLCEKRILATKYNTGFFDIKSADFINNTGNDWLNAVLLDPRIFKQRDSVIEALLADGFESRALFTPLHMLDHFKHCPRQASLETSEDLWRRAICLPSTP